MRTNLRKRNFICLFVFVSSLESPDSASRIDELLLSRKERMAQRTYFDLYFVFGRSRFKYVSASACDGTLFICGMNALFHYISPLLRKISFSTFMQPINYALFLFICQVIFQDKVDKCTVVGHLFHHLDNAVGKGVGSCVRKGLAKPERGGHSIFAEQ